MSIHVEHETPRAVIMREAIRTRQAVLGYLSAQEELAGGADSDELRACALSTPWQSLDLSVVLYAVDQYVLASIDLYYRAAPDVWEPRYAAADAVRWYAKEDDHDYAPEATQ